MMGEFAGDKESLLHICWNVESEARMEPPIQTVWRQERFSLERHFSARDGGRTHQSTCAREER